MSTLKDKSETYLHAALKLTQSEDICLASIHCSYYSCYQLLNHYLETKLAYGTEERKRKYQDYLRNAATKTKKLGSHDYWINEFIQDFKKKKIIDADLVFNRLILLKTARHNADYEHVEFRKKDTDTIYDIAKDVRKLMIKTYEP